MSRKGQEDREPAARLSERLRAARTRLGWSRETLAHHSGLSWSAISQIESGRRTNVRPGTLEALASTLGITADYLLGLNGERALFSHEALLYASPDEFRDAIVPVLRNGMERSESILVATTGANIELLMTELEADSTRIRFEDSSRWYQSPAETLTAFRDFIQHELAAGAPWVTIVGEPVWRNRDREDRPWVRYESMVNIVFASMPVSALCPYDTRLHRGSVLKSARLTHPRIVVSGEASTSPEYLDPADYLLA